MLTISDLLDVFEGCLRRPDGLSEFNGCVKAVAVSVGVKVCADNPHDFFHGKLTYFDLFGVGHAQTLPC
jgi:hypothetical protein